jgi:hypothetical protein
LSSRRRRLAQWLQIPAVGLLCGLLFPPTQGLRPDLISVFTPGTTRAERASVPGDQVLVALPGADAPDRAEPAPDLATAIRRHPEVRRLQIFGDGLSARDRPAAAGLALQFDAASPHGLVELDAPASANLGWRWQVEGRATAPATRVELRDPAGAVVDAVALDATGRFALSAPARATGRLRYELRLLGGEAPVVETISLPLVVRTGVPLTVLVRAGALNPELKYWRRWAADAGLEVALSVPLTEGVSLRAGAETLDADGLARVDVAIVDARAWDSLSTTEKAALRTAAERGMGLLLRADGPLSESTANDWRALGFALTPTASGSVTFARHLGLRDRRVFAAAPVAFAAEEPPPRVATGPAVAAARTRVLFAADDAMPLAEWRSTGRGRIGITRLLDSFRLVLAGDIASYGALWADTLGVLARARPAPPPGPDLPHDAWVDERITVCGLGDAARIARPAAGPAVTLRIDHEGCAAYWPSVAGWHTLETRGTVTSFYVRAATDGASLRAALARRATAALVSSAPPVGSAPPAEERARGDAPMLRMPPRTPQLRQTSRWPWALAWLGLVSAIWWLERPDLRRR